MQKAALGTVPYWFYLCMTEQNSLIFNDQGRSKQFWGTRSLQGLHSLCSCQATASRSRHQDTASRHFSLVPYP